MRRDKDEIKSEILRRRDEYRQKKIRFWRTMGISAASGLATFAIVFLLVTSPMVKRWAGKLEKAPQSAQLPEKPETQDTDTSEADGNYVAECANDNADSIPKESAETRVPGDAYGLSGMDQETPGPWICGTPALMEAMNMPMTTFLSLGAEYGGDGQTALRLTRTEIIFAGEEVKHYDFWNDDGREILSLIVGTLRSLSIQEAPLEPDGIESDFIVNFEFADENGKTTVAHVGVLTSDFVFYNNEFCAPRLTQSEHAAMRDALRAFCD